LELLAVVNLVFEAPLHDLFAHFLDALDEQRLQLVSLRTHVDPLGNHLLGRLFLSVDDQLQVANGISVAGLESLHILDDLLLHIVLLHARLEDQVNELLELDILSRDALVAAPRRAS